jgi:hypothetical protein
VGRERARRQADDGARSGVQRAETVVDAWHGLIVTHEVTTEATDDTSLQTTAEAPEAQGIVAHIPANRAVNNQGEGVFFDCTSFAYDEASDRLRCPAGQTLQRMHARDA